MLINLIPILGAANIVIIFQFPNNSPILSRPPRMPHLLQIPLRMSTFAEIPHKTQLKWLSIFFMSLLFFLLLVLASCQSSVNMVPIKQQKSSITKTSDGSVKDEYSISIVDIERYMELCGRNVKHLISPYLMGSDTCLFIV